MKTSWKSKYLKFDPAGLDTVDRYRTQLIKFCQSTGFETITAMAVFDHADGTSSFHNVDNTPAKYLNAYYDPTLARVDPVMQHCKRNGQTLVWNQATYVSAGYGSLWEHQAKFGYRTGIALALHSIGGRHFFLGVDRNTALAEPDAVVGQMSADLRAFAAQARDTAFQLFLPPQGSDDPTDPLTAFELECLRWSMDGNNSGEISDLLKASQAVVVSSLYSAMKKLNCVTKYQAIIKALRLKLIA